METKELTREEKLDRIYKIIKPEKRTKRNLRNQLAVAITVEMGPNRVGDVMQNLNSHFKDIVPEPDQVLRGDVDVYVDKNCFWVETENSRTRDMEALQRYWNMMHYGLIGFHNKPVDERPMEMIDYIYSLILGNE